MQAKKEAVEVSSDLETEQIIRECMFALLEKGKVDSVLAEKLVVSWDKDSGEASKVKWILDNHNELLHLIKNYDDVKRFFIALQISKGKPWTVSSICRTVDPEAGASKKYLKITRNAMYSWLDAIERMNLVKKEDQIGRNMMYQTNHDFELIVDLLANFFRSVSKIKEKVNRY